MKLIVSSLLCKAEAYMLPCVTKKFIGIDCPGCGLQRSLVLLFQGDGVAAFKMYPPIYSILVLLLFMAIKNFIPIKYANKLLLGFTFTAIAFILTNYILKFI